MDPRIHELIEAKQIGAIALDTSVFDAQQRQLERGLLRRVAQFHRSDRVRVLIPDVVRRESLAHLARDAKEAQGGLARAVRKAARAQLLSRAALDQLRIIEDEIVAPTFAPEARLASWLGRTGADVLDVAARVDIRTLFDRYFAAQAPFAEAGEKKHEFPDAASAAGA
ncbi:PIN domain-containing protein [Burkholderia seminalis]|uniref:PIN domain-containing protein n=1 Tax=Burkholderia seminalis TaxID=488731 RepID=UPI00264D4966|nr:PIN domain-containing protein [Burkholderia seminalis]MDN7592045.1 PIN domain-containing protein [Burkholderia seminalis]